jgi:hypothetical protein
MIPVRNYKNQIQLNRVHQSSLVKLMETMLKLSGFLRAETKKKNKERRKIFR